MLKFVALAYGIVFSISLKAVIMFFWFPMAVKSWALKFFLYDALVPLPPNKLASLAPLLTTRPRASSADGSRSLLAGVVRSTFF